MKKLLSEESARYLTRVRQRAALKQKAREQKGRATAAQNDDGSLRPIERKRRERQRLDARTEHLRKEIELTAPENFSLIHNPEEMIRFFDSISAALNDNWAPRLNLRDVKSLGPDAIAVLNATLDNLTREHQVSIAGSVPKISTLADILLRSGFYEHVTPPRGVAYTKPDRGLIAHEMEHIVDTPKANELVQFAMKSLTGAATTHRGAYVALGEMMHNTFDHASRDVTGKERWWASVYYDDAQDVAHFTFLDNGVGILGSRPVRRFIDPFRRALNLIEDTELLQHIFQGKLASRTGLDWRGQGLPRVYNRVKNGQLPEMTVLTNRVIGNLEKDEFRPLDVEFAGTLYHWEIRVSRG